MITYNKEERKLSIEIEDVDIEQLNNIQKAIIDLMNNYNFDERGNSCQDTIYYANLLLEATFLNEDQLKKIIDK